MAKTYAHAILAGSLIGIIAVVGEAEGTPIAIWALEMALATALFVLGLER